MADGAVAQALVLEALRRLVVREPPLPNLGDDDAPVLVAACGLCGTDHEQFTGELAFVPGHETVDAIGPERHSVGVWPPATGWPSRCSSPAPAAIALGLDDAEDLLATMAGERDDVPPVHGVLTL
jgi:hypothetical protein